VRESKRERREREERERERERGCVSHLSESKGAEERRIQP